MRLGWKARGEAHCPQVAADARGTFSLESARLSEVICGRSSEPGQVQGFCCLAYRAGSPHTHLECGSDKMAQWWGLLSIWAMSVLPASDVLAPPPLRVHHGGDFSPGLLLLGFQDEMRVGKRIPLKPCIEGKGS